VDRDGGKRDARHALVGIDTLRAYLAPFNKAFPDLAFTLARGRVLHAADMDRGCFFQWALASRRLKTTTVGGGRARFSRNERLATVDLVVDVHGLVDQLARAGAGAARDPHLRAPSPVPEEEAEDAVVTPNRGGGYRATFRPDLPSIPSWPRDDADALDADALPPLSPRENARDSPPMSPPMSPPPKVRADPSVTPPASPPQRPYAPRVSPSP
jgi:hypothetical protein